MGSLGALSGCASAVDAPADRAAPGDIVLFQVTPLPSYRLIAADADNRQPVAGPLTVVPERADSKASNSSTRVATATWRQPGDALTLDWHSTRYAALKIAGGAPLDLRPYVQQGTVEFDLNVHQLAKGGINFRIGCGADCERKVPYLLPARAAAGKGWQHVALSMQCFAREGDDFSAITEPFALEGTVGGNVSIANIVIRRQGTPNADCPDYRTASVTPGMLNEASAIDWWLPRHEAKLDEVRALRASGTNPELVFVGDSITHFWERAGAKVWERNYARYHALNLGFGGDRTENILWRLQHGEVDDIAPKVAVVMMGTNNTGHRQEAPERTAAGIKRNLDELRRRLPRTKILLLAIFPRQATPDGFARRLNEQTNAIIANYADNEHVFFLNINQAFLQPDGTLSKEIMPDLLHPNGRGYELWAEAMRPELERLLK